MAVTHTEVYRPFKGALSAHPFRFVPLFLTELSVATRRKLPLVLLFGPVTIATIVVSFMVHAKFSLQEGVADRVQTLQAQLAVAMAGSLLEVRNLIEQMNGVMSVFALLSVVWFGSGLICEDHRAKAHLLYFSRPLTRSDYFLGKLCTAAFFGALSVLVPDLVVCTMAVLASPDWSFLTEQGDVIVSSIAYGCLWVGTMSMLVLAVSAIAPKKVFAIVGFFAFFMITEAFVGVGLEIGGGLPELRYLSVGRNLGGIAEWLFAVPGTSPPDDLWQCALGVGGALALAGLLLAYRLRKMELSA